MQIRLIWMVVKISTSQSLSVKLDSNWLARWLESCWLVHSVHVLEGFLTQHLMICFYHFTKYNRVRKWKTKTSETTKCYDMDSINHVCVFHVMSIIIYNQLFSMGYWPSVRSRWLDIGQVLFLACLWTETKSRSINSQKKKEADIQPSWLSKLGQ